MGKSTISMAIFNSYVKLLEGTIIIHHYWLNPSYIPVLFSLKFPFVLVKFT
jgi:hypothetical protein